jgi:hypothetical protein
MSEEDSNSTEEDEEFEFRKLLVRGMFRAPSPQSNKEQEETFPSYRELLLAQAELEEEEGAPEDLDNDRDVTLIDNRRPKLAFTCLQINEFPGKVMTRGVFPAPSLKSINHFKYYSLFKKVK